MRLITLTPITGAGEDMFDEYTDTQTETATEISKTFSVAGFNCVAILNTYGISASLTIDDELTELSDSTVLSDIQTVSLIRDSIKDWWDYWFAPSRIGKDVVFYFPTQPTGATATLNIAYPGGTAKCGMAITGVAREVATTKYGAKIGITDYSKISTDGFGRTYLNPGNWAKRADMKAYVYNTSLDITYREIVKNRGAACIFDYNEYTTPLTAKHTSDDGIQALIVYGYTEDFGIGTKGPTISEVHHESQGLV